MIRQAVARAIGQAPPVSGEEAAYRRLAGRGYRPASVIDVGAFEGHWTRLVRGVFPGVPVLMVEAQAGKLPALGTTAAQLRDVEVCHAALSATAGQTLTFYEMETGSSLMPEQSNAPRREANVVTRTLDEVAAGLEGPIFLKLDVQGAEIEVLRGGGETLKRCNLVQLEVALLPYNKGAPTFLETLTFMDDRGLVPLDFGGMVRPDGINLVQTDVLFVPRDSPLRPDYFRF